MKFLTTLLLLFSMSTMAGLPPTTTKGIGDTLDIVTFKKQFPNYTISHTGTTAVIGGGLTTAQILAIASPTGGMQVYNTDLQALATYNATSASWQYGFGNIVGDTIYSAYVTSTGTVSQSNKPFLASCTNANPVVCTFAAGYFTTAPNCQATSGEIANYDSYQTLTATSTTVTIQSGNWLSGTSAQATRRNFYLSCQKTGADYTAASAQVFATTNRSVSALYTGAPPTGTINNSINIISFGTKVVDTDSAYSSGSYTIPSGAGGNYDIQAQYSQLGGGTANSYSAIYIYINGTLKYQYNARWSGAVNDMIVPVSVRSVPLAVGDVVTIRSQTNTSSPSYESNASTNFFSIVKTNSGIIVGSFAGYGKAPGLDGSATPNLDIFSYTYGTTNTSTVCSGTPCFVDQIGSAVSSVTRSGTGTYTDNYVRTYSKLKCSSSTMVNGVVEGTNSTGSSILSCSNCNSMSRITNRRDTGASADTSGTILCQGSY